MLLDLKQLSAKTAGVQNRVGAAILYRNKVYLCNSHLMTGSVGLSHSDIQLRNCWLVLFVSTAITSEERLPLHLKLKCQLGVR